MSYAKLETIPPEIHADKPECQKGPVNDIVNVLHQENFDKGKQHL